MKARPRFAHRLLVLLASTLLAVAAAAQSGSAAATGPAANSSRSTSMAEKDPGGPFTFNQLKPLVPDRIGRWKRTAVTIPLESSVPAPAPTVVSAYRNGKLNATLTLRDGGADSAANEAAQWKGPPNRRETESGREYVYREGLHTVREIEKRDASGREVMLILTNGIVITASGEGVDMVALKALANGISVAAAEALVRPAQ